jgi:GWxTD domain-containing protein
MKKVLVFLILMVWAGLAAADATADKNDGPAAPPAALTPEQKKWLDQDVVAIISDYERNAFVSLKTAADRDKFIEAFWEDRDPTPGTKRNEYRDEYDERMKYVVDNFGHEGPPAWKTDRGKVYLLLGKPGFRKRFPEEGGMWPVDFWQYRAVREYGLPGSFYLLFYQKNGIGAYRLYSPSNDGPEALVQSTASIEGGSGQKGKGAMANETGNPYYEFLRKIDVELADATFSLLPTEGHNTGQFNDASLIGSEFIVNKVESARNYRFDKREYVERILSGRPKVDVYVTLGPQDVKNDIYWFMAPNGDFMVDYAVLYAPDKFNMGQYEDQYYTSLTVDGTIQTAKDNVIVEAINNSHEIKLDSSQFDKIRYSPFQYLGRRLIVPGNYKISLLIHNNLTKSIIPIVEDLQIPDFDTATKPYFSKLLLVQSTDKVPAEAKGVKPFQFGTLIFEPLVDHRYAQGQEISFFYQLFFPERSLPLNVEDLTLEYETYQQAKSIGRVDASLSEKLHRSIEEGSVSLFDHYKLPDALNGPARVVVRLKKGDTVIAESQPAIFSYDPARPSAPWRLVSGIPDWDSPYHKYVLAQQYIRLNQNDKAEELLKNMTGDSGADVGAKIQLMKLELKAKQFDGVLSLAHDLEIQYPKNKDLLWLIGWAHYGLDQYDDAVRFFERGRLEEPNNLQILNTLADVYLRLSRFDKSLEMIDQSLKLNPDQPAMMEMKQQVQKQAAGG